MFAFQSGVLIGEQNLAAVEKILSELGIPIVARSFGGTKGKRMALDVASGVVTVEAVGSPAETL